MHDRLLPRRVTYRWRADALVVLPEGQDSGVPRGYRRPAPRAEAQRSPRWVLRVPRDNANSHLP